MGNMRLIDADKLIEQFYWIEVCRLSKEEIKKIINEAPTVCEKYRSFCMLKSESPQGEWIAKTKGWSSNTYACSVCGRLINCTRSELKLYPFCHCGADMRNVMRGDTNE